jgi:NDP-sugar pyrophosphorylase family protein
MTNFLKKEQSVLGSGSQLGEKVIIKQCAIGNDCRIGSKSKLNNCVLIGNVEIGERSGVPPLLSPLTLPLISPHSSLLVVPFKIVFLVKEPSLEITAI